MICPGDIADLLSDAGKGTVAVGVGNTLRADDGFGPVAVENLKSCLEKKGCLCIEAGPAPENVLGKVEKSGPGRVIFFDAADFRGDPGTLRLFGNSELLENTGSATHDASLGLCAEHIKTETGADIYLVGFKPVSLEFGKGLSGQAFMAIETLMDACR